MLRRTAEGGLHFKGEVSHAGMSAVFDTTDEVLKGSFSGETKGGPDSDGFQWINVFFSLSHVEENVPAGLGLGVSGKRDQLIVVPGPQAEKQRPSQWFDSRLKGPNVLTADQEIWVLFRSKQLNANRLWIERVERDENTFTVTMNGSEATAGDDHLRSPRRQPRQTPHRDIRSKVDHPLGQRPQAAAGQQAGGTGRVGVEFQGLGNIKSTESHSWDEVPSAWKDVRRLRVAPDIHPGFRYPELRRTLSVVLAENSRGDKTAIEPFLDGVRDWDAPLRAHVLDGIANPNWTHQTPSENDCDSRINATRSACIKSASMPNQIRWPPA